MIYKTTALALLLLTICSCSVPTPLSESESKAIRANGIHIVERDTSKPRFTVIGTTVFNNELEEIPGVPTFAQHLAGRLREKGLKVTISGQSEKKPQLNLAPFYPYQQPGLTGLGIHRRSFLGVSGPLMTHCNFVSSYVDQSSGIKHHSFGSSTHPIPIGYQMKEFKIDRNISSWKELSADEKALLKKDLNVLMKKTSDQILYYLGL